MKPDAHGTHEPASDALNEFDGQLAHDDMKEFL